MGESSCLAMQGVNSGREASPVSAFGDSVSFGRFMSESLDWGRWSSFRHNRYLEEVAKYSRPGSVAQKKAFFEANYKKKLAARKEAEASLEQSLSMESSTGERRNSGEIEDRFVPVPAGSTAEVTANEEKEEEIRSPERSNLDGESNGLEKEVQENKSLRIEDVVPIESSLRIQLPGTVEDIGKHSKVSEIEACRPSATEMIPLKESGDLNQKKVRVLESKSPVVHRSSRLATSPMYKLSPSQAKCGSSMNSEQENKFPPTNKCVMNSTERKRSAANSLYRSTNLSEYPKGVKKPSLTKAPSILEKVRQFEMRSNSSKASQDRFPTSKTPVKAPNSIVPKLPPMTLNSGRNGSPTRHTLYGGRRKVVPQLQTLSSNCLKVFKTGETKSAWQIPSTSSNNITDEKPEKREEPSLNMEDSLYTKGTKKAQIQGKVTERAESGLTKLRPSLCFKARPMPDFFQKLELSKNEIKKIPLTRPRSPKLGKRNNITSNPGSNSSSPPLKSSPAFELKQSAGRHSRTASYHTIPQHKWRI